MKDISGAGSVFRHKHVVHAAFSALFFVFSGNISFPGEIESAFLDKLSMRCGLNPRTGTLSLTMIFKDNAEAYVDMRTFGVIDGVVARYRFISTEKSAAIMREGHVAEKNDRKRAMNEYLTSSGFPVRRGMLIGTEEYIWLSCPELWRKIGDEISTMTENNKYKLEIKLFPKLNLYDPKAKIARYVSWIMNAPEIVLDAEDILNLLLAHKTWIGGAANGQGADSGERWCDSHERIAVLGEFKPDIIAMIEKPFPNKADVFRESVLRMNTGNEEKRELLNKLKKRFPDINTEIPPENPPGEAITEEIVLSGERSMISSENTDYGENFLVDPFFSVAPTARSFDSDSKKKINTEDISFAFVFNDAAGELVFRITGKTDSAFRLHPETFAPGRIGAYFDIRGGDGGKSLLAKPIRQRKLPLSELEEAMNLTYEPEKDIPGTPKDRHELCIPIKKNLSVGFQGYIWEYAPEAWAQLVDEYEILKKRESEKIRIVLRFYVFLCVCDENKELNWYNHMISSELTSIQLDKKGMDKLLEAYKAKRGKIFVDSLPDVVFIDAPSLPPTAKP